MVKHLLRRREAIAIIILFKDYLEYCRKLPPGMAITQDYVALYCDPIRAEKVKLVFSKLSDDLKALIIKAQKNGDISKSIDSESCH